MESRAIKFPSRKYGNIVPIRVIPGHFASNHSHINYYIDLTTIKTSLKEASESARVMAQEIASSMPSIDTIVCLDDTKVVGALMARELVKNGSSNTDTVHVITPECNAECQMFFRENVEPMVRGKNVLLLMASVSTGITVQSGMECIQYYGGKLKGICTIFSAIKKIDGVPVHSLFSPEDIPGYASYARKDCPFCQNKQPVEALINNFGYSKL